jgi:hypothetical protein
LVTRKAVTLIAGSLIYLKTSAAWGKPEGIHIAAGVSHPSIIALNASHFAGHYSGSTGHLLMPLRQPTKVLIANLPRVHLLRQFVARVRLVVWQTSMNSSSVESVVVQYNHSCLYYHRPGKPRTSTYVLLKLSAFAHCNELQAQCVLSCAYAAGTPQSDSLCCLTASF